MTPNEKMDIVDGILLTMLGRSEFVDTWWTSQNFAFGMQTPMEVWYDDHDRVVKYVLDAVNR
jgi:hypothetical protein